MKVDQRDGGKFCGAGATMALVAGMASTVPSAYAGGTIKADDDKFISLGMGTRTSFTAAEDGSASGGQWTTPSRLTMLVSISTAESISTSSSRSTLNVLIVRLGEVMATELEGSV